MVTGGNGGIGLAVARRILSKTPDAIVWLGVHSRRERAEQLAEMFAGRAMVTSLGRNRPSIVGPGGRRNCRKIRKARCFGQQRRDP